MKQPERFLMSLSCGKRVFGSSNVPVGLIAARSCDIAFPSPFSPPSDSILLRLPSPTDDCTHSLTIAFSR